jgi:trehalose 6-phosphate phosphatase
VSVATQLEPFLARPDRCAVMSDIDGTLAPIAARPDEARVPEATAALLAELAQRYALVACITGRRALEGRRMVGVPELVYVGNHGYERLDPGDEAPWADPAAAPRSGRTADFAASLDWPPLEALGLRREDKGPIQVLHWRGAPDEAAAEEGARVVAAQARARDLVPHWGRKALELRPVSGIDKGSAVHRLLVERAPLDAALFVGDDRTDLDAFRAMRALAGSFRLGRAVSVGVDSPERPPELATEAEILVDGTDGVLEILRELAG